MAQQQLWEALDEVHDGLTQTIKQVANEPSVGLFFIQQHVHKALPDLLDLKNQLADAAVDVELSTADAKDALNSVRVIKEIGSSVIGQMINSLNSTCSLMPAAHRFRGNTSKLFPRPTRPFEVMKGPLRTISVYRDLNSNTMANKQLMPSGTVGNSVLDNTKGQQASTSSGSPYQIVHHVQRLQSEDAESTSKSDTIYLKPNFPKGETKKTTDSFVTSPEMGTFGAHGVGLKPDFTISPTSSCETKEEDATGWKSTALEGANVRNPACYMPGICDSALSKNETISIGSAKIGKGDSDNQISDKFIEKRNWLKLPSQDFLGFGGKLRSLLSYAKDEEIGERQSMSLDDFSSFDFEQFKAERAAKLELWLSESDGNAL